MNIELPVSVGVWMLHRIKVTNFHQEMFHAMSVSNILCLLVALLQGKYSNICEVWRHFEIQYVTHATENADCVKINGA